MNLITVNTRARNFTEFMDVSPQLANDIADVVSDAFRVDPNAVAYPRVILATDAAFYAYETLRTDLDKNARRYEDTMSPTVATRLARVHAQHATDHAVELWHAWDPAVMTRIPYEDVDRVRAAAETYLTQYLRENFIAAREPEPETEARR